MPLLKRKPFTLKEPPKDLKPNEHVYQVRFTKEMFQDYDEYLNRVNLYRQRIWTCKSTGKSNLTYEEALVSEKQATEKVQDLPSELTAPALEVIHFSMLPLQDLSNMVAAKLHECFFVGAEVSGRKGDSMLPCRILRTLGDGAKEMQYEVAWLDRNKKTSETSVIHKKDLIWKKPPFTRSILKSFIRESTYRSFPWVLHENLSRTHKISNDLPEELGSNFCFQDGVLVSKKNKRKNDEDLNGESKNSKRKKENAAKQEEDEPEEEPVKYPIDDLLVQPGVDDPVFIDRPSPTNDFGVPMDSVGDLLMVWDFCTSFDRFLKLSPFSFEDFEKAICHNKDMSLVLVFESHSALFRLLLKDDNEYSRSIDKQKRKSKITLLNWADYLCDFLKMINIPELCTHTSTIKRGYYGLVDPNAKVGILRELVNQVLETNTFREKLDEHIEQRHAIGATRRGQALEEARKRREEKERLKSESEMNGVINWHHLGQAEGNQHILKNCNHIQRDGVVKGSNGEVILNQKGNQTKNRENKHSNTASSKISKKPNMNGIVSAENENGNDVTSKKESLKQLDGKSEPAEKKKKEQKRNYFEREMEKRFVRTNTLGKDRHYNRYWWFPRDERVFVESCDSKQWGYYSTKEEVDALMGSLNIKGEREMALKNQLEKNYNKISFGLEKKSKSIALEEADLRRSSRIRAPPGENPANAFLKYVNKWKED